MPGGMDAGRVYVTLGFDLDDRQLKRYDEEVARLRAQKDVKTELRFDYERREYEAFVRDVAAAKALKGQTYHIKVDYDRNSLDQARRSLTGLGGDARSVERDLTRLGNSSGGASSGIMGLASAAGDAKIGIGFLSVSVGDLITGAVTLGPVLLGVVGVLSALVGSLGAATLGFGALGTGIAGTFLPVAALAIGAYTRLSAISKAYQAQAKETASQQTRSAEGARKETGAANALASALDGLTNAHVAAKEARISVTRAEEDYGRAVEEAKKKIQDARDAEVAAARDVQDATENLTKARVDAQRALEDAERRAEDTAISQADAARRVTELQNAGQTSGRGYFDAQRTLSAATTEAQRAAEDNADFAQRGVRAYQPLEDAIRRLADVTKTYHQRQADLRELEKQGIARAPGVVAAVDRERTSREALARSLRAEAAARRAVAGAGAASANAGGALTDANRAREQAALAALSPTERGLLGTIHSIVGAFRSATKDGVDALLGGLDSGLKRVPPMLHRLEPDFKELGGELGQVTDNFFADLTGPRWESAWHQFSRAAGPVINDLERITTDWMGIFRDIAVAVLPDLKTSLDGSATSMDDLAEKVHRELGSGGLQKDIHGLVTSFRDWWQLIKDVGGLLVAFFGAGKDQGDTMVVSLDKTVKKWHEWIDSNPQKIRDFFKHAREFIDHMLQVLGPFVGGWIKFADKLLDLASGLPVSWLQAFGAAWLAMAGLAKFAGVIKVLELMKGLVGRRLPVVPGGGGGGLPVGPVGAPGRTFIPTPGGRSGGASDARGTIGRATYGPDFVYGAPESQLGSTSRLAGAKEFGAKWGGMAAVIAAAVFGPTVVSKIQDSLATTTENFDLPKHGGFAELGAKFRKSVEQTFTDPLKTSLKLSDDALKTFGDHAESNLKKLRAAGDTAGLARLAQQARDLAKQFPDAADKLLRFADAAETGLQGTVVNAFKAMERAGGHSLSYIKNQVVVAKDEIWGKLGTDTQAAKDALAHNFDLAADAIRKSMASGKISVKTGLAEIEQLMRAKLSEYGITGAEATRYIRGQDTVSGKPTNLGTGAGEPRPGHAMGGWIGAPGERGGDNVGIAVPAGSAIYNAYQQPLIDMARRLMGGALFAGGGMVKAIVGRGEYAALPGEAQADDKALRGAFGFGLADLFRQTAHTRHGFASGGHPAPGLLGDLNRRFPAHSLRNAVGHFRMTPDEVMGVAQAAGLPGRQFEQIAHGESDYYPGIVEDDEGGGVRGYGIVQNTTKVNGPAFERVIQRLGGWLEQLNPFKAMTAAKWLYDRGGLSHWRGTRYLGRAGSQDTSSGAAPPGGVGALPSVRKIALPPVSGRTALDAVVSGALRGGVRGANAVLDRVAPPFGPLGGAALGPPGGPAGLGSFDGVPVARWIVPILQWAQRHGWRGSITSGYRSHAYNVAQGRTYFSNHEGSQYPGGAVDVGGYGARGEGSALARVLSGYPGARRLVWGGPVINDWGHFSATGHATGGYVGHYAKGGYLTGHTAFGTFPRFPHLRPGAAKSKPSGSAPGSGPITDIGFAELYTSGSSSFDTTGLVAGVDDPPSVYVDLAKTLDRLQSKDYPLADRRYSMIQTPLIDGETGEVNQQGIAERVSALQDMLGIRQQIVDTIQEMIETVRRIMDAYREAIRRLTLARPFATLKTQSAIDGDISSLNDELGSWGDRLGDLGYDFTNAQLDVQDTLDTIAGVKGTKSSAAASTATVGAPSAEDVAAAAMQQVANFQASRAELFGSFGQNFVASRLLAASGLGYGGDASLAAGTRYFGAVPAGTGGVVDQAGGDTHYHLHAEFSGGPPADEHTFTQVALHELRAATA